MTWVFAIVGVLVLGVVALVASGWGSAGTEAFDDQPDALVPADRPLRSGDLHRVRLPLAVRGYRMAEVDALLDRLSSEMAQREEADREHPRASEAEQTRPADGA